jgi:hypothetical protein
MSDLLSFQKIEGETRPVKINSSASLGFGQFVEKHTSIGYRIIAISSTNFFATFFNKLKSVIFN